MSGLSLVLLPSGIFDLICNSLQARKSLSGTRKTSVFKTDMPFKSPTVSETAPSNVPSGHRQADPQPSREPPPAPPVIILSQNSSRTGGSQPHSKRDPGHAPLPGPTSFSLLKDSTSNSTSREGITSTAPPKKPHPEPHPAPPVIILSAKKRPASASPTRSPSPPTSTSPGSDNPLHTRAMGSKGSKVKPVQGKLQSSQDKRDKDEMKEPSNYYTHRSKSMRRKAGKEGPAGVGGAAGGSGGAGGVL